MIVGENEWASGTCQIKDLSQGHSTTAAIADAPSAIVKLLAGDRAEP